MQSLYDFGMHEIVTLGPLHHA